MQDTQQQSADGFPEECLELVRQLYTAAVFGEFDQCMLLQKQANECMSKHGIPAHDFPEEYFRLWHVMLDSRTEADSEHKCTSTARMEELMREAGVDFQHDNENINAEMPPEYYELGAQFEAAMERGDVQEMDRLAKESDTMLRRMGIVNIVNIIR